MKKEIKFSAKLDSAEFDRSVEQMQRKLKDMYAPADAVRNQSQWAQRMEATGSTSASKPTQEAYQKATQQARREVDQFLATEVKRQDQLSKTIEKRIEKVKELKKAHESLVKGSEEELRIKEKIAKMEDNTSRLREIERGRAQAINQTMDVKDQLSPKGFERIKEGYQQGGIRGAAQSGVEMLKGMGPAGIVSLVGGALVAAGAAAKIGGDLYAGFKNAPVSTASNYGSAMTGVMGREVSAAYSGRSALEMAFLPEKQRAMKMANEAVKGIRVQDKTNLAASPLDGAVGATLKGAAVGGAIGSFVPVIGTAIGAGIGGAVGFGANALGNVSSNARQRSLALSPFSETHNAEYESMIAKDFSSKYGEALQGIKEQNPFKTMAAEQYDNSYTRYLDSQRSMGLENFEFHGLKKGGSGMGDLKLSEAGRSPTEGFRERAINAGFTDDMAMGASSNILSAGGSTRMARDSVFALQASRQFDQTNSAGVLGQLSGSLGSSETSKQAYVKMMAEGTRQGLDSSEYREESRKMMEVTAGAISKSGVSSTADIERIVSQMGGFLSDKTNRGVQSAKEAFDFYNQASSEVGGPRGTMRAAGMMRDEKLGKMDAMDRAALAQIPADQLNEEDPAIKHLAKKYEMEPKEMIDSVLKVNKQSFNFRPGTDKAMNEATELKKQLADLKPEDEDQRAGIQEKLDDAMGRLNVGLSVDNMGMSTRTRTSLAEGLTSVNPDEMKKALSEAAISDKITKKDGTGRMEDTSVAGAAEGSRVVLENFQKFSSELAQSPDTIRSFNEQLAKTVEILNKLPQAERAKAMGDLGFGQPQTQPTGGKSK